MEVRQRPTQWAVNAGAVSRQTSARRMPAGGVESKEKAMAIRAEYSLIGEETILSNLLGMAEFNPKGVAVSNLLNTLCHHPGVNCYNLLTAFTGNNCCLNASTVELFLKYEPQPTSTKNMVHLAQTFRDGILTKYNYGVDNIERYGQWTPPIYNLSNIPKSLPLYLSYGGRDYLSDVQDVGHLLDDIKFHDADKLAVHYVENYAHADFVMGVSAKQMVYDSMITFLRHQE